tara:strand:- start:279 stop:1190 length:912 start_codon:yes stop_codon:yes gene_type:complete
MGTNVLNKYNDRMLEKQEHSPPDSEEVNKVFKTSNYDIFKLADDVPKYRGRNRIVKENHANTVVESGEAGIKEHGQIEPILVKPIYKMMSGENRFQYYLIIQGQHRFMGLRKFGLPVMFMVHSNYETEDMTRAHLIHKSHSWKDYLRKWISDGRQDYITYQDFITKHDIGHDAALCVLDMKDHDAKNQLKEKFNEGNLIIDIDNLQKAEKLLDNINTLKPYCDPKFENDIINHKQFIIAMMKLMNDRNRKNFGSWKGFEVLRSKLEGSRNLCISYSKTTNGYLDNIESIFNHGAQRQNRIYFV